MKNYRKTSHSVYDLKVHLVWITKALRINNLNNLCQISNYCVIPVSMELGRL